MVANPKFWPKMTGEEYLAWEDKQEFRHEYIDGEIIAMSANTLPHNDITLNFYTLLRPHLSQKGCRINVSDVKVQAKQNSRYFYPDLVVSCHAQDLQAKKWIEHPTVIIEVLSPSTESYDSNRKLKYYREIPSLQEYVLIEQEEMGMKVYQRGGGRMWLYYDYSEGEIVSLNSIDFSCPIELIL